MERPVARNKRDGSRKVTAEMALDAVTRLISETLERRGEPPKRITMDDATYNELAARHFRLCMRDGTFPQALGQCFIGSFRGYDILVARDV